MSSYQFGYSKLPEFMKHCVTNLTLLFKFVDKESQFKVITSILVIYRCCGVDKNLGIEIFLQMPLSTTVRP